MLAAAIVFALLCMYMYAYYVYLYLHGMGHADYLFDVWIFELLC